jgi:uncharacterized protein (TIGR00288 family)
MPTDSNRPDVAVFIDFENVYVSVRDKLDANPNFETIMDRCEDLGRVVIARAYADWYRYPRVTSALYANGIEPMYVPTYYYDRDLGRTGRAIKNSVDMNLCVDAMKTLFTNPNISKFVLATGDRDFIPLVNTIRQQGKEVIIIGIGGAASAHLAQSADEFIFYEALMGKAPASLLPDQPSAKMPQKGREAYEPHEAAPQPVASAPVKDRENGDVEIYDVLVKAINLARERGYVCSFGSLKLLMKELMGGEFKEGRYKDANGRPFAKFKDFVMEAERRNKVQVFTNGTVNEVFLPGEDPYKLSQFAQELKVTPPAPVIPEDGRGESRNLSSNGRGRRRRRRPGGQRSAVASSNDVTAPEEPEEIADDLLEAIEPLEALDPFDADETQAEVGDEIDYPVPTELFIPDLSDEPEADFVFNGLLDRIEQEGAERATLEALDPLVIAQSGDEPTEVVVDEPVTSEVEAPAATPTPTLAERPFTEDEWDVLRGAVARFERPASFAQIHDALRDTRNRPQGGISRTNEELRTLIKQAINTNVLQRIGKGNRVAYQLAPQVEAADETPETETQATPDQMAMIEQALETTEAPPEQRADADVAPEETQLDTEPDQMAMIEQAVEGQPHPPAESAEHEQAELETPVESLIVEVAQPEAITEQLAPPEAKPESDQAAKKPAATKSKSRSRKKPEPKAEVTTAVAEAAPTETSAKPKRSTRRKATPAVEAKVDESANSAEPAKPKAHSRRKKAEEPQNAES